MAKDIADALGYKTKEINRVLYHHSNASGLFDRNNLYFWRLKECSLNADLPAISNSNKDCENRIAVGEKYINKNICTSCNGNGYKIISEDSECPNCDGAGWCKNDNDEPSLCIVCEGSKYVLIGNKLACNNCNELGYNVAVMQNFEEDFECPNCKGDGEVDCECVENETSTMICDQCDGEGEINCDACGRTGIDPNPKVREFGIKQWKETNVSKEIHSQFGEKFYEHIKNNEITLNDNQKISVIFCPKCINDQNTDCWICNNNRIIKVLLHTKKSCIKCCGEGKIYPCNKCRGDGLAGCDYCHGTLKRNCWECDAIGYIKKIVSRML